MFTSFWPWDLRLRFGGSKSETLQFFQASGLVKMFSPAKKTSTHTSSLRKKSFDPQRWDFFLMCLSLALFFVFFFMLAHFEVCEDDVVSCLKGQQLVGDFIDNQVWVGGIQPGRNLWLNDPRDMKDSKQKFQKLSLNFLLKSELCEFYIPASFATFLRVHWLGGHYNFWLKGSQPNIPKKSQLQNRPKCCLKTTYLLFFHRSY